METLDLKKFQFPKVSGADMVFPTFNTIPDLLKEAEKRGFLHGNTPYNRAFSTLFFDGGRVQFKKDIPEDFKQTAWAYCRAFMASWEPKHEHKEAVCAMLMSELVEAEIQK